MKNICQLTDEILVKLYEDGNNQAFEILLSRYKSKVYTYIYLIVRNKELTEDIFQETFIKAYLNIRSFQGISAFSTWLYRIAYNTFYDSVRAKRYHDELNITELDKKYSTEIDYSSEKNDIFAALKYLRKDEQTAILLCYMEDKTHKEIAKIMNIPLGTVKTNILKGKEKMGKYLTQAGYGN